MRYLHSGIHKEQDGLYSFMVLEDRRRRTAGPSLANSELQQSVRESTRETSSFCLFVFGLKCEVEIEISD